MTKPINEVLGGGADVLGQMSPDAIKNLLASMSAGGKGGAGGKPDLQAMLAQLTAAGAGGAAGAGAGGDDDEMPSLEEGMDFEEASKQ